MIIGYRDQVKDIFKSTFQWATKEGVMIEEKVRGMRINILDMALHSDSIHSGEGQLIPAIRRAIYASELTAKPRLVEPIYLGEILCNNDDFCGIEKTIYERRGIVYGFEGYPLSFLKFYLPVAESFGFN